VSESWNEKTKCNGILLTNLTSVCWIAEGRGEKKRKKPWWY